MDGLDRLQKEFNETGFTVVSNAVPHEFALEARQLFLEANWNKVDQFRPDHFKHVFKTNNPLLPREEEAYIAKFSRAYDLEKDNRMREIVREHIRPILETISLRPARSFDIRALKMDHGDLMRVHIDDYAGDVGFIWYLCSQWIWDWGGILTCAVEEGKAESAIPQFNQLVVINHSQRRVPHWVTPIADYAKESRLTIVGFSKPDEE